VPLTSLSETNREKHSPSFVSGARADPDGADGQPETALNALRDELRVLESRAGIAEEVERAQLGAGTPSVTASAEDTFDENQAYARRSARDLYFAVGDVNTRKQLIRMRRACRTLYEKSLQRTLTLAHTRLTLALGQMNAATPWFKAICVGALFGLSMSLAFWAFFHSLIAFALFGLSGAQSFILLVRTRRSAGVSAAQDDLEKQRKTEALYPDWFSAAEEASGQRDEALDRQSSGS
jgi:hypothetical protein